MKEKNTNWKIPLIIVVGVIAVILMGIFWVQGFQNKAINYEEQVNTAQSDIKVQEKRRVDLVYNCILYTSIRKISKTGISFARCW